MKPEQLQALARSRPRLVAEGFSATLHDFGYAITPEMVEPYIAHFFAGEKPVGGPEAFVHGWLRDGMD